jgi:SAM-dependent methyltransferase
MESYHELALVYDRLMRHIDFSQYTDFYMKLAERHKWIQGNILDLACGTGNIMFELLRRGFDVTGVDVSSDMLSEADNKLYQAGFTPQLICQDIRELAVLQQFALVLCAFDSLNYILQEKDLKKVISRVNKALLPDGLFIFDMHSEYKVNEILGNNAFSYEDNDIFYTWQNNYDEKRRLCRMKLDIFTLSTEDLYKRIEEFHEQRFYPIDVVMQLLEAGGFKMLGVYGDQKVKRPSPRTERVFFVARKNEK